jgi:hypothetical protein
MNVRVRQSMLATLDTRRKGLGLTRDEWIRRVIEWALLQPPGTPVRVVDEDAPSRPIPPSRLARDRRQARAREAARQDHLRAD